MNKLRGAAAIVTSSARNGNSELGGGWIAVVIDDPRIQELIVLALGSAGYAARAAGSAEEALYLVREEQPELVITDIELPGQSGYELCRILRDRFGDTLPVLFVSGIRTETVGGTRDSAIRGDDAIFNPFDPGPIVMRVRRALARSSAASIRGSRAKDHDLSAREREVLRLIVEGLSQKEIAARLEISPTTVATRIQRISAKLQVHSRAEAVAPAYPPSTFGANRGRTPAAHVGTGRSEVQDDSP